MFGTTCKVGATRCTTGVQEVWRYADPENMHKDISIWDVFGFNDEEAYDSIETIKEFVSLHAVLLLYRDDIMSCKNTIELFRAAVILYDMLNNMLNCKLVMHIVRQHYVCVCLCLHVCVYV